MIAAEIDMHPLERELYALVRADDRIFRFLEEGSLDGIWYADLESPGAEWMSPRYKRLLGYEPHEVPDSTGWWQSQMHPDDLVRSQENFRRHRDDPKHPYDQIVRYRHRDGSTVWVRCRGIIIRDDHGRPVRMLGAHTDVTELKRAETLASANAELANRNEALRRFASIVSHDLQTPMRHVSIYSGLLREALGDELPAEAADFIRVIERGAVQMRRMVQSLHDFSRLAYADVRGDDVDLAEAVADALALLELQIAEAGATVTVGRLPTVRGDRTLLTRVFQNLVSNAIKYRGPEPLHVGIAGEQVGEQALVSVTDNGIGIDPRQSEIIFEMFRRLHSNEKTYDGLGVGLAISRQIVDSHGGRIWLDTGHHGGSRFCFLLPRTKAEFERARGA